MNGKVLVRSLLVILLMVGFIGTNYAQDVNKATEAFNKALELQSTDPQTAISEVKSCLEICESIGEDADDLRMRAELKLPELYYNVGNGYLKAKKYKAAIPAYQEAVKVAQQYNTPKVETRAKKMLPQLFYAVGGGHYKKEEFDDAVTTLNKAIEVDADYAKAYYTIGLVYKKQGKMDDFESIMEKGIVAATNSRDNNYKKKITKAAASTFLASGAKLTTAGKNAEAIADLEKALKFEQDNPEIYFYLGSAYNNSKLWDKAIDACNKGLAVEKDDQDKQAKHYYNMGLALKGKGDKTAACNAFKSALFGQFKENAQYEIEHELKCN